MLICIGAPLVIAGILWGAFNLVFLFRARETTGKIVGEKSHRINRSGTTYSPIVEFKGPDGKMVEFTENLGSSADLGAIAGIGQLLFSLLRGRNLNAAAEDMATVKVIYDPNKPTRAHIKSFHYLFFYPTLIAGIGFLIMLLDNPLFVGFWEDTLKPLFEQFIK